jgi:peroxiredoxin
MQQQTHMRRLAFLLALAGVLLLPCDVARAQSMVGRTGPNITLPNGGMFGVTPTTTLKSYRGDVVLVVFWSTKCSRCRTHMALVQRLHARYKDKGLKTLAVASSSHAALRTYMRSNRYNFGAGADPQSLNLAKYGVRHYPATFLVGRDGRVKSSQGKLYRAIDRELRVAKR